MPKHKCGRAKNAYEGMVDTQVVAGAGLFANVIAVASAYARAVAKAQAVYDRDCPANCKSRKSGEVAYRLASVREVKLGAFEDPAIPPGIKRAGYQIVIRWRLLVRCERAEQPAIGLTPTVLDWDLLEQILRTLLGDNFERQLKLEN